MTREALASIAANIRRMQGAGLREALSHIALASRRATTCSGPCMYPQRHSDDESSSEFAYRLQEIARAALAKETP